MPRACAVASDGRRGEARGDELGDLHGVERGALAQVVVADEQHEALALGRGLVGADATETMLDALFARFCIGK